MYSNSARPHSPSLVLRVGLLVLLAAILGTVMAQQPAGITVTGTGTAYGEPDQAILNLGVAVTDENVRSALSTADARMETVRDALVEHGVAALDVRTSVFNVWRQEIYDDRGEVQGERYHVEHQFEVVVRDSNAVGDLLALAVDAGANSVGGITFTFSDPASLRSAARDAAVTEARARAAELARLNGATLGAPTAIIEGAPNDFGYPVDARFSAVADGRGSSVSAGQLAVQVNVTITFALLSE